MKRIIRQSIKIWCWFILGCLLCACKIEPREMVIIDIENIVSETSVTGHVEAVTPLGATLVCYANLPAEISAGTSFGVLYSTDDKPTLETANSRISKELDTNNQYRITISGLSPSTKYYYRSFVNQNGILKYGRIKEFATADAKIVSTGKAEKVSAISANIPVVMDLSGIYCVDARIGVCYSVSNAVPDLYSDKHVEGIGCSGRTFLQLQSLMPGTAYHYRAYAIVDGSLLYGDCLSFVTEQDNIVSTEEPSYISHISATVSGRVNLLNCSFQSGALGICYDETGNPTVGSTTFSLIPDYSGVLSVNINGLEPDRVYYYRAFAMIDNTIHYGAVYSFRTPALFNGVEIDNVSPVSASVKAIFNMADTRYTTTEFGLCYNENGNPTIVDNICTATMDSKGNVNFDLQGLCENTKYYVRPYAKLDGILFYGKTVNFSTPGLVAGCSSRNVSAVSAELTSSFDLANALYGQGEFGICYGKTTSPSSTLMGDLSDNKVTVTLTALESNTRYYYRGYAKIDGKEYYGEMKDFTTASFIKSSQVSNVSSISAVIASSYDLANAVYNDVEYGVCLSKEAIPTTENTRYVGSLDGNGVVLEIKKLSPVTSYYYRGYAIVDGVTHYGDVKQFATGESRFMKTGEASGITYCSASLTAQYDLGNSLYDSVEYGICYSDKGIPTIAEYTITSMPDETGNAVFFLENLKCSTEYYYKPFVTVDGATYYGDQSVFETAWDPFVVAEIEAGRLVDMGLSVHWASCNIDASSPENVGNLYAWGETVTKETFTESNNTYKDYVNELPNDHDVAHVKLGGTYRMPREIEVKELVEKCSWEWTDYNSVWGYTVTGPNGNSIFLPSNKHIYNGLEIWEAGYWSKSKYIPPYGDDFYVTTFGIRGVSEINSYSFSSSYTRRYIGFYVRPVSVY